MAPRIKLQLAESAAPRDRAYGVGTLEQICADIAELDALGCDYLVLDTNPDHPRPRDFAAEQADLAKALATLS